MNLIPLEVCTFISWTLCYSTFLSINPMYNYVQCKFCIRYWRLWPWQYLKAFALICFRFRFSQNMLLLTVDVVNLDVMCKMQESREHIILCSWTWACCCSAYFYKFQSILVLVTQHSRTAQGVESNSLLFAFKIFIGSLSLLALGKRAIPPLKLTNPSGILFLWNAPWLLRYRLSFLSTMKKWTFTSKSETEWYPNT